MLKMKSSYLKLSSIMLAVGLIIVDLLTKSHAASNYIKTPTVVIKNILSFFYVENRGAAFSLFEGKIWFFILIAVLFVVMIIIYMIKYDYNYKLFNIISFMGAGALGNLYDRITLGYVRDFIKLDFINFPIFNMADIYITISAIALFFYIIFDKDIKNEK